jgi:hypothetical protein
MRSVAAICLTFAAPVACKTGTDQSTATEGKASVAAIVSANTLQSAQPAKSGCRDNAGCAANEYCVFTPGLCGKGTRAGSCRPRPTECTTERSPVCGCDGEVYDTECQAGRAGVDLSVRGGCQKLVPDWASCGSHYCDVTKSYCEIYLSDVFEIPTDYRCRPLPPECRPKSGTSRECDCFPANTPCLSFCGHIVTGGWHGFHLTCQGKKPPYATQK